MRVIFVFHGCNRGRVQNKITEFEKTHNFQQILTIEDNSMPLDVIYMKHYLKDICRSFKIKNGLISDITDFTVS